MISGLCPFLWHVQPVLVIGVSGVSIAINQKKYHTPYPSAIDYLAIDYLTIDYLAIDYLAIDYLAGKIFRRILSVYVWPRTTQHEKSSAES